MLSLSRLADDIPIVQANESGFRNESLKHRTFGLATHDNDRRDGEAELHAQAVTSSPVVATI